MEKSLISTQCPHCNHEFKVRLDVNRLKTQSANFKCPKCKQPCHFEAEKSEVVEAEYAESSADNGGHYLQFPKDFISIALAALLGIFIVVMLTEYQAENFVLKDFYLGMIEVFNPASDFYDNRIVMICFGLLVGAGLVIIATMMKVRLIRFTGMLSLIAFLPAVDHVQYIQDYVAGNGEFAEYDPSTGSEENTPELGNSDGKALVGLTVFTEPSDARVRILNIAPKYHDEIALAPGKYHIEVSKTGYTPYKEWINIQQTTTHHVALTKATVATPSDPNKLFYTCTYKNSLDGDASMIENFDLEIDLSKKTVDGEDVDDFKANNETIEWSEIDEFADSEMSINRRTGDFVESLWFHLDEYPSEYKGTCTERGNKQVVYHQLPTPKAQAIPQATADEKNDICSYVECYLDKQVNTNFTLMSEADIHAFYAAEQAKEAQREQAEKERAAEALAEKKRQEYWGAIAVGQDLGYGYSYNAQSSESAQQMALNSCEEYTSDCEVQHTFQNACLSLYVNSANDGNWATTTTKNGARSVASDNCDGNGCKELVTFCSAE